MSRRFRAPAQAPVHQAPTYQTQTPVRQPQAPVRQPQAPVRQPQAPVRRPRRGGGFSDDHSTMTNITWQPDQQDGMGNAGFMNAVYYPDQAQQCQPMSDGGGFLGGVLGALMGGTEEGDTCAPAPAQVPQPPASQMLWV